MEGVDLVESGEGLEDAAYLLGDWATALASVGIGRREEGIATGLLSVAGLALIKLPHSLYAVPGSDNCRQTPLGTTQHHVCEFARRRHGRNVLPLRLRLGGRHFDVVVSQAKFTCA